MHVEISRAYEFQAAHFLPLVPAGHKCSRMHGHTYTATIVLGGKTTPAMGWLIDFGQVDAFWARACAPALDHQIVNQTIDNPTSENIARWILTKARAHFGEMAARVTVSENGRSAATVFA